MMIKGLGFHRVGDQWNYWTIPGELPTKVAMNFVTPASLSPGYWSLIVLWCSRKFSLSVSSWWRGWCRKQSFDFHICQDLRSIKILDQKHPWAVSPCWYHSHNTLTQRVDTTIKSNIMDHMDNMVCWESASLSPLKGNASGKLLLFYGVQAFLGIREVLETG